MGSLFSAPKVSNRSTRLALQKAQSTASHASSNINKVSSSAAKTITNTGATAANNLTDAARAAASGITSAVNQWAPGILSAANAGADSLSQLSGNLNQYFTPLNYNAGGLTATYGPNGYTVTPDAQRQALIDQLYGGYNSAATAFGDLRNQWTPGESALRNAQLQSIENARQANISDLRENLAKRSVLGSSFAQDAQTRANMDFEQQKNQVISQTYLQELDAQNQLIQNQYAAATNAVATKVNELNLEGNVGMQLTSNAQDLMKQAATLRAQLATDAAQLKLTGATAAGQLGVAGMTAAGQLTTNAAANAGQLATGAAQSAGQIVSGGAANAGQIGSTGATNIANINSQLAAEQARLNAQAQQGAGALLGTLALAPLTGGTSLLGAGFNLLQGNQAFPTPMPMTPYSSQLLNPSNWSQSGGYLVGPAFPSL